MFPATEERITAARKILNAWRASKRYKAAHPFVPLRPVHGEQLQATRKPIQTARAYDMLSADSVAQWLVRLLNGAETKAYRLQFTALTTAFHQKLNITKTAASADAAAAAYLTRLSGDPYFIYEVMNLFILGYVSEYELLIYIEIFAYFQAFGILKVTAYDNMQYTDVLKQVKLSCGKSLANPDQWVVTQISVIDAFEFFDVHGQLRSVAFIRDNLTMPTMPPAQLRQANWCLGDFSHLKVIQDVLQGRRPVNFPYTPSAPKESHGVVMDPWRLFVHDLGHLESNAQEIAPGFIISAKDFLNQLYHYIKNNLGLGDRQTTAYLYYLVDFLGVWFSEQYYRTYPLFYRYTSQSFNTSYALDEILLAWAALFECVITEGNLADFRQFPLMKDFDLALLTEIKRILQDCNNNGLQKMLRMKYWLFAHNFFDRFFSAYDACSIKIYCLENEQEAIQAELNGFLSTGSIDPAHFKLLKLSKTQFTGPTILDDLEKLFNLGFVNHAMALVYMSPSAAAKYDEQNTFHLEAPFKLAVYNIAAWDPVTNCMNLDKNRLVFNFI